MAVCASLEANSQYQTILVRCIAIGRTTNPVLWRSTLSISRFVACTSMLTATILQRDGCDSIDSIMASIQTVPIFTSSLSPLNFPLTCQCAHGSLDLGPHTQLANSRSSRCMPSTPHGTGRCRWRRWRRVSRRRAGRQRAEDEHGADVVRRHHRALHRRSAPSCCTRRCITCRGGPSSLRVSRHRRTRRRWTGRTVLRRDRRAPLDACVVTAMSPSRAHMPHRGRVEGLRHATERRAIVRAGRTRTPLRLLLFAGHRVRQC
ncbi:uncharacterized protein LAESUDRAFT_71025 [Laetiporus sulphureus 93-53]|uniref:Uncharacterized protein n=1 Tax=Laetiporus sulphureus 93-53 TaxID=1314785 RepID=A0A165AWZ1_9APHY|nr:uncharacterized protein LAESUDRAFT_71025 [Laetiporus sulphureus 93-53]KZS99812.1 hypothetical protein LAESUDRAFT_71025 [Laetiporus sulphureus 93-53]